MANNGWKGQLDDDRWDPHGCFGTGTGSAPHGEWYDVRKLIVPSTVGDQHRMNGWTKLETPVNNTSSEPGSPDPALPDWKLPTGCPERGYNAAAEQGLTGP